MKHILVTGGAGFIGSHLIESLLLDTHVQVTCLDNFDPFYGIHIKKQNIAPFLDHPNFTFVEADITNLTELKENFTGRYDAIVHLAAKAGVRSSIEQAQQCYTTNVLGTQNMLELAKHLGISQFVFGSSSSVYGINSKVPWQENDTNFFPISPYAATKISGEMMGHVYANLFGIRMVALRFFTVYGPRQRPDLAIHKFTKSIYEGSAIPFYGDGNSRRDYTFVSDIVKGIIAAIDYRDSMFEVINLGNNQVISLNELIDLFKRLTGESIKLQRLPAQAGDVPQTYADIAKAKALLEYNPQVSIEQGLGIFIDWYTYSQSQLQKTPAKITISI
jgi:UDP-glucuronate 4-epimerase